MIAVIQCAARKQPHAGHMIDSAGRRVVFVAHPEILPSSDRVNYARPDDLSDDGSTWRERLVAYNNDPADNALGLLKAIDLYAHPAYRLLGDHLGVEKTYILSAGWGLLRSDFLTPGYDITFSASADSDKRRRPFEKFDDFKQMVSTTEEPIVFFGGKDYVRLFAKLTEGCGKRIAFFNSVTKPDVDGVEFIRYGTSTRTNWHYGCINALISGKFSNLTDRSVAIP
jgi:hypothetical protein